MGYLKRYSKHPAEILDYDIPFDEFLSEHDDDTIDTYKVETDRGLEIVSSVVIGPSLRGFISGGEAGRAYDMAGTIVTVGGRTKRYVIQIRVRGRGVTPGGDIDPAPPPTAPTQTYAAEDYFAEDYAA